MKILEILTAISLFCGSVDDHNIPIEIEACRKAVWKCIDKERAAAQKCGAGFLHKDNKDRFVSHCEDIGIERCFR